MVGSIDLRRRGIMSPRGDEELASARRSGSRPVRRTASAVGGADDEARRMVGNALRADPSKRPRDFPRESHHKSRPRDFPREK
jgi:hypothetical protein